jgi:hypothetical protein
VATTIYTAALPAYEPHRRAGDVVATALAEDGRFLGKQISSSPEWAQRDMGPGGHFDDRYAKACPEGYEIVWVEDCGTHKGWQAAMDAHRARTSSLLTEWEADRWTANVLRFVVSIRKEILRRDHANRKAQIAGLRLFTIEDLEHALVDAVECGAESYQVTFDWSAVTAALDEAIGIGMGRVG